MAPSGGRDTSVRSNSALTPLLAMFVHQIGEGYSIRNSSIGSTEAALRAGR
jgi:hypothetical protein